MGFPYIFRGALDVQATTINDEMKIAAAEAIAMLARDDVPDEVAAAYKESRLQYGRTYIIAKPFDRRMISRVASAVAQAAMDSGVARKPIIDMDAYRNELSARLDPTASSLQLIFERVRANPRRVVFAEGEEEKIIRAAALWRANGHGTPVLIGNPERVKETMESLGLGAIAPLEVRNPGNSEETSAYIDLLYGIRQRQGSLLRDCQRLVTLDRNVFAACMVAAGDADAMITGLTRSYWASLERVSYVLRPAPGQRMFGLTLIITRGKTVFIADSVIHQQPRPAELADIAVQAAAKARSLGHEPRVALLSYSTFGNPAGDAKAEGVRAAVKILDEREVDFAYDGELSPDVALDPELLRLYPFCRLPGPANVLITPDLHSANIASKLVQKMGGGTAIGPLVMGLEKPVQILQLGATVSDILNLSAFAAVEADR